MMPSLQIYTTTEIRSVILIFVSKIVSGYFTDLTNGLQDPTWYRFSTSNNQRLCRRYCRFFYDNAALFANYLTYHFELKEVPESLLTHPNSRFVLQIRDTLTINLDRELIHYYLTTFG
mmetsp:Transcript_19826/g.29797  ORF Transcript_19826/g.29797 Transcript_19826/m.29797 type:complete len:118 (-) Transcript_19826:1062-1415(-)